MSSLEIFYNIVSVDVTIMAYFNANGFASRAGRQPVARLL